MGDGLDESLTGKLDDLTKRLDSVEQLLWSLAVVWSAEQANSQRAGNATASRESQTLKACEDVKRPLQTDGLGPWPPADQPLPEGWEEVPQDDQGRPQRTGWDPWNPEIPKSGKVITYDPDQNLFRIECGGIRYEIPWKQLEPPPPFSNPGPPSGLVVDFRFIWVEVRPEIIRRQFYFRQAHCKTQITCVATWKITVRQWRVRSTDTENRVIEWITMRTDTSTRTEIRRRTSDFTCPKPGS